MGIIRAAVGAVGGGLADQWLEAIEPDEMSDGTVMVRGVKMRKDSKRNANVKGTDDVISDGSVIHVYPNQCMLLVDGGKIIDYTVEEGYFTVSNESMPSMFSGSFGASLKETFGRFKYGGITPTKQKVFYINLKEIRGIKFGTPNPINYFDYFYNAELFLRAFGTYSIKISDPIKFFIEVMSHSKHRVDITDINAQYQSEFLSALQAAINKMSADKIKISHVASKSVELSKYMSTILDEDWSGMRGMMIQAVGIANISYDEESKKMINMRNQGAMLGDATIREGFVQGSVARGLEAAGSNAAGAGMGFLGVGMGMNQTGGFMQAASGTNQQQMQQQQMQQQQIQQKQMQQPQQTAQEQNGMQAGGSWQCSCGETVSANFCSICGTKKPLLEENGWECQCGMQNPSTGKFCKECGIKKPEDGTTCEKCGHVIECAKPKFCPECGTAVGSK